MNWQSGSAVRRLRTGIVAVVGLGFLTPHASLSAQEKENEGVFAGRDFVRLQVSVTEPHVPVNGYVAVRCELSNASTFTLLVTDVEIAGGSLGVVVRDSEGNELDEDRVSHDSAHSGELGWGEKMRFFWHPVTEAHFVGKRIDVYPSSYSKMKIGHRYQISARLVLTPDPKTTEQEVQSIFPGKTLVLRGEIESKPVWITIMPPCCVLPKRGRERSKSTKG